MGRPTFLKLIILIHGISFSVSPLLLAQTSSLRFERFTIDDGLSQNFVACITQDSKGFLWFGTRDGLNRYDGYHFKVYSHNAEDTTSISANDIRAIYEDKQGNLWVGTFSGGLNKYDRAADSFIRYQHDPETPHSLSHNDVQAILEDRLGVLWIGTAGGLNRFDPNTESFTRYLYQPDEARSRGHNDILTIVEDQAGNLWLGTSHPSGGLLFFDRRTESFTAFEPDPAHPEQNNCIQTLYQDASGNLWAGAFSGLFRIKTEAGQSNHVRPNSESLRRSEQDWILKVAEYPGEINAICQDPEGKLWLGSSTFGLFIYDIDSDKISEVPEDPLNPNSRSGGGITAIFRDRSDLMWLGTNGNGASKLNRAQQRFGRLVHDSKQANSLGVTSIRSICEDKDGNLWIGGYGGLDYLDRKTGRFTHYQRENRRATGFGGETVWAIYEDPLSAGDRLWLGTEAGGLYRLDRRSKKFLQYPHVADNSFGLNDSCVFSIYRDRSGSKALSGTLWLGTVAGLSKFDEASNTFKSYNYSAENATVPSGRKGRQAGFRTPSGGYVMSICESDFDSRRVLWLATENGLNCFDPATEQFTHFLSGPANPNNFSQSNVNCIHQDRSGRLWLGTSGGLSRLVLLKASNGPLPSREGVGFVHYTETDGLPNNFINGILEDEQGNLWLSTNKGISRFNPDTKTFRNYDTRDGLQSAEFNRAAYYRCRHGEMFFGGIAGLNMFFPEALKDNPHRPIVVITDFKIFNESVAIGKAEDSPLKKQITIADEIRLSYQDHVFSFEFAALEFTAPEKNQYAYKMEGFDADWVHVGTNRTAIYTNLDPGEYNFRVKGSNHDGVWNEEGVSLKLVIAPPWWRTWWFGTLASAAVLAALITAYRLRIRALETRRKSLEILVAEKTRELQEKNSNLQAAYKSLREAQAQLVASEKMAALGHLIAGVAHEINTPLGAVQSSSTNMARAVEAAVQQLPKLFETLSYERRTDFLALVERARQNQALLTAREKRQFKQDLMRQLQAANLERAEAIADTLVDMGIFQNLAPFFPLFLEPNSEFILEAAYNLARLQANNQNIMTAVERAAKVVFALKSFIHFDRSGEKVYAQIAAGLETVLALYYHQLKHGLEVQRNYDHAPAIKCFPDELNQVWTNLIHNALQAMAGKGRLEIAVNTRETSGINQTVFDSPRRFVVVSITDSGVGIPEENLPHIFEPFFTTKPAGEGSGLGLSISKNIIDKHGGEIVVKSQPGRTTFEVWLPAE